MVGAFFEFEVGELLITKPENMPGPGAYYTTFVDMKNMKDFPFDYCMYFSTDHHKGLGGIWLYLCKGEPSNKSNWKSYDQAVLDGQFDYILRKPNCNPIFVENIQGHGHTETPFANLIGNKIYMSYHKDGTGHSQATLLAISEDGVNFRRVNGTEDSIILNYDIQKDVGNGHTGYFRWGLNPFSKISKKYVGYSLHGGGDRYYSAQWVSDDAIKWERNAILVPQEGVGILEVDKMIIWHEIDVGSITKLNEEEYVAICGVGNRASGSAKRIVELYEIYLGSDGCSIVSQGRKIMGVNLSGLDSEELSSPCLFRGKENLELFYVGVSNNGNSNVIMTAKGRINKNVEMPPIEKKII